MADTPDEPSDDVPLAFDGDGMSERGSVLTPMEDIETLPQPTNASTTSPPLQEQTLQEPTQNPFVSSEEPTDTSVPPLFSNEGLEGMDVDVPASLGVEVSGLGSMVSTPTPAGSGVRGVSPGRIGLESPTRGLKSGEDAPPLEEMNREDESSSVEELRGSPRMMPTTSQMSPQRSPQRSPVKSPQRSPRKSPEKSPQRSPVITLAPPAQETTPKASMPRLPSPTISFTAPPESNSPVDDGTSAMLIQAAMAYTPPPALRAARQLSPGRSIPSTPAPPTITRDRLGRVLDALALGETLGDVAEAVGKFPELGGLMIAMERILVTEMTGETSVEALRGKVARLEAEKVVLETEMESRAHVLENQTRSIRGELQKVIRSEDGLKQQVDSLAKALENERKSTEQARERVDACVKEVASLKATVDSLELDKRNLASAVASKIEEQESYSREISRLRSDLDSSRSEVRALNAQLSEMQAREVQVRLERATRDQEGEQLRQNVEWLNQELSRKAEEFRGYRKEKSEIISKLEMQLENAIQEKKTFELQATSQQEKANSLEKRVSEVVEKLKESENRIISSEQSFKNEMNAQLKISSLYQSHAEDLAQQVKELQALLTEVEGGLEGVRVDRDDALRRLKEQSDEFQVEMEKKELLIEEMSQQIKAVNAVAGGEIRKGVSLDMISPAAQAASQLQKSGKTFTEIILLSYLTKITFFSAIPLQYADYTRLQDEHLLSSRECARLSECLNHVLSELAERAPVVEKVREDKEMAEKEVDRLTLELKRTLEAHESSAAAIKSAQDHIDSLDQRNRMLTQESHDLGRQVQHLMMELETLRAGPGGIAAFPPHIHKDDHEDPAAMSPSGRVISQRLVIFNSIAELQNQNQQLRASLRAMSDALEQSKADVEGKYKERVEKELEEAATTLEGVREQLRLANLKCESYVREREQWKRIAENRGVGGSPGRSFGLPSTPVRGGDSLGMDGGASGEYERLYRELQRDFDSFRKETGLDTRTLKEANETLRNEKSELSIQAAKLNSAMDHLNERYRSLSQNADIQTKENSQLRTRIDSLVLSLTSQETKAQELANHLVDVRASMDALSTECRQLRSERELLKSSEARVMAENSGLVQQRNMANEHLKSLQRMFDDLERQGRDNVQRLEEKASRMEKEVDVLRHQLSVSQDELRAASLRRESEQKEVLHKIERLSKDLAVALRDCEVARMEERLARQKVEDLQTRLTSSEGRIKDLEAAGTEPTSALSSSSDLIKELKAELLQVRSDLDNATESLKLEKERVEQYKAIANAAEEKLAEFNSTYDRYREETDQKISEAESMISSLERNRSDLEERLGRTIQEITELQEKSDLERMEVANERARLNDEIARLKKAESHARESVTSLQLELNAHSNRLTEARSDYERVIIAEAERIRLLQASEKEVSSLKKENMDLRGRASSAEQQLATAEKSWESIQQKFKDDLAALERTNEDLDQQNKILHNQFESINTRLQTLQDLRSSAVPLLTGSDLEGSISSETEKNLADVIRYLRREKDILEKEREVSEQKIARMHSQIEHLQRSLDEARVILNEERQKSSESADAKRMHSELLEKIDSLNILRESNATLRSQNEVHIKRISLLEGKIRDKEHEFGPLKEENITLKAELETVRAEIKALEEDNARWKGRTQQILAKYERIDPVEHQQLKEKVAQVETLRDEAMKELESHKQKLAEVTVALDEKSRLLADAERKLASAETDKVSGSAEIVSMVEQLEAARKEKVALVQKANAITLKFREQVAQLREQLKVAIGEKDALIAQKNEMTKVHEEKIAQLTAQMDARVQEEKAKLEAQIALIGKTAQLPSAVAPATPVASSPTVTAVPPVVPATSAAAVGFRPPPTAASRQTSAPGTPGAVRPLMSQGSSAQPAQTPAPLAAVRPSAPSTTPAAVRPAPLPVTPSTSSARPPAAAVPPSQASSSLAPAAVSAAAQTPVQTQPPKATASGPSPIAKRTREEEAAAQTPEQPKASVVKDTEMKEPGELDEPASKRMRLEKVEAESSIPAISPPKGAGERASDPMVEDVTTSDAVIVEAPAISAAVGMVAASAQPANAAESKPTAVVPGTPLPVPPAVSTPETSIVSTSLSAKVEGQADVSAPQSVHAASATAAPAFAVPSSVSAPKPADSPTVPPKSPAPTAATPPGTPATPPVKIQRTGPTQTPAPHATSSAIAPVTAVAELPAKAIAPVVSAPATPSPATQPATAFSTPSLAQIPPVRPAQPDAPPSTPATGAAPAVGTPTALPSTPAAGAAPAVGAPTASQTANVNASRNELLKRKLAKMQPPAGGETPGSPATVTQPDQGAGTIDDGSVTPAMRRQRIIRTPGASGTVAQSQPPGQQGQPPAPATPAHLPSAGGPGTPMPQRMGSVPPGAGRGMAPTRALEEKRLRMQQQQQALQQGAQIGQQQQGHGQQQFQQQGQGHQIGRGGIFQAQRGQQVNAAQQQHQGGPAGSPGMNQGQRMVNMQGMNQQQIAMIQRQQQGLGRASPRGGSARGLAIRGSRGVPRGRGAPTQGQPQQGQGGISPSQLGNNQGQGSGAPPSG
ncbi:hypothetical protein HDU67_005092 [Dinochytrium kinnereticum]|nr:hypothetical protein HDU67_005092 [Dinochytrium kinnereticum]